MNLGFKLIIPLAAALLPLGVNGQYMRPQANVAELIESEPLPVAMFTSKIDKMITFKWKSSKTLDFLYEDELRLAGMRFKPKSNTLSGGVYCYDISVTDTKTGESSQLKGLPPDAMIRSYQLSPDQTQLLFTNKTDHSTDLWIADLTKQTSQKIASEVNDIFPGVPLDWSGDGKYVFYLRAVNKGKTPPENNIPSPQIRISGESEGYSEYQDLLQTPYDEKLFDFYAETEIIKLDVSTLEAQSVGTKGIITSFSVSPDGKYVLATYLQKPYSTNVPYSQFGNTIKVIGNNHEETIAENPLHEHAYSKVNSGARNITWCAQKPHTLLWVTAIDKGTLRSGAPYHDMVTSYTIGNQADTIMRLRNRLAGIYALNDTSIIIAETSSLSKNTAFIQVNITNGNADTLLKCNEKESPHRILQTPNIYGRKSSVYYQNRYIYLTSEEYTREGACPTLIKLDLRTKKCRTIWKSKPPKNSKCEAINPLQGIIAIKSESPDDYPNYYIENIYRKSIPQQISQFASPYQQAKIQSQLITYMRSDSVMLSATLYLPNNYDNQSTIPTIVWAYPKEYTSNTSAEQISTSAFQFSAAGTSSAPIWLAAEGYAVIDASFPIISQNGVEPNDSFINQIVMNAEAAVNALVERKIADRNRIAVGGQSYGAFMTANLLAHTQLFAAGIAQSGCYNRTNTPLGFQNEKRTLWQAKQTYLDMSPILFADHIKAPLLLIHGEDDNNPSTPALQSEKLYAAVKHCNGTAKLVILPKEQHTLTAIESKLHAAWEIEEWLNNYLKKN